MSIPESIKIGTRIQVGKDRATVKFIGKVQDTKGEWLGIEWDDPKRGKHDGSHKNTKYFECRYIKKILQNIF
jgi:dynactin complex subunit